MYIYIYIYIHTHTHTSDSKNIQIGLLDSDLKAIIQHHNDTPVCIAGMNSVGPLGVILPLDRLDCTPATVELRSFLKSV